MRRPTLSTVLLVVIGTAYAIAEGWRLYEATPLLSRDLLLIIGGYGAIVMALTAGVVVSTWPHRSKRANP